MIPKKLGSVSYISGIQIGFGLRQRKIGWPHDPRLEW